MLTIVKQAEQICEAYNEWKSFNEALKHTDQFAMCVVECIIEGYERATAPLNGRIKTFKQIHYSETGKYYQFPAGLCRDDFEAVYEAIQICSNWPPSGD